MKKKLISLVLTLCLLAALLAVSAFAVDRETGYNGEALPDGQQDMSEDVINVTAANAQYTLDGAYGDINGKTINFTGDGYNEVLVLGRPTKYAGSGTKYYSNSGGTLTEVDFEDLAATGLYTYARTVENVTFTSEPGVVLPGFALESGHIYGSEYDYVRDTSTISTTTSYHAYCSLENIEFEGLTISGQVYFNDYSDDKSGFEGNTEINRVTFDNCTFTGDAGQMADSNFAAIKMNSDIKNFSDITVEECEITNYYQGIYIQGAKNLTVSDSKISNTEHNSIAVQNGSSNEVRGEIEITGNKISNAGDRAIRFGNVGDNVTATVSGNTFTDASDDSGEIMKAGTLGDGFKLTLENNTLIEDGVTKSEDELLAAISGMTEASIGSTYYPTLSAAIAAAQDGDTIYIYDDAEVPSVINAQKTLTFTGVTKPDGTKPVITSGTGGIFSQTGSSVYTLENLNLQATRDDQWYIYHSANKLTVTGCEFTMASGVTHTGNVIMGEGHTAAEPTVSLEFTNSEVKANSRAALTGVYNNSVITGNTFDLISEHHGDSDSRTSVIAITAAEGEDGVTITGNTFMNANRAVAVDNSTLEAEALAFENNKFINVRYAFELDPEKNADCGVYDLNNNYYEFGGAVSELKVQDASSDGDKFADPDAEGSAAYVPAEGETDLVDNDVYYTSPDMEPEDLNTYNPPTVPDPNPITITQPANGTVSTNFSNASVGATITVTATPNSGYVLSYITVNGEKIEGNTFVMPDAAVTVSAVFVPATGGFADVVPGAWYVDAVNYVVANGLMEGTSATTFEPDARMTRAMFWTILARIDGETITGATWADDARAWAMANGVSDGTNPHAPLTREQLVTMLWRYLGEPSTTGTLTNYTDANAVSAWAETAMAWAIEKGIITGVTPTTLAPQSAATRAQCATILMRNAF